MVCIPLLGWLRLLPKQIIVTAKCCINFAQLWLWQSDLFCQDQIDQIRICYVYLTCVAEALDGGFKLHHIWPSIMFCCCTTLNYIKGRLTTSHHDVSGLHEVHLISLKISTSKHCMEKQSSHFRMKCLWRVWMTFYRQNWMGEVSDWHLWLSYISCWDRQKIRVDFLERTFKTRTNFPSVNIHICDVLDESYTWMSDP